MESDVLPVTTCLVATPQACIALCTCPTVEGDDEGTCVITKLGHHLGYVSHTIESERVAGAYPCHVGLEDTYASVAHLSDDIALQQRLHTVLGVEVRLSPQTQLHAMLTCIFAKLAKILHVTLERTGLSVAGAIAIIGEDPSERHIMSGIAVNHGTCRELVVITLGRHLHFALSGNRHRFSHVAVVLLTIERLSEAAIILLALLVALAILEEHTAYLGLYPVVAVVGIEVTLIESELGQQYGVTRELIEVIEQRHRALAYHHEEVEVVTVVLHLYSTVSLGVEVIHTLLEGIPHHAVATR